MTQIEVSQDGFVVDADLLAKAFKLPGDQIQTLMREGTITSISETGVDEDAGQSRLTFHYGDRAVRFVVDAAGTVLKRSSFPATARE